MISAVGWSFSQTRWRPRGSAVPLSKEAELDFSAPGKTEFAVQLALDIALLLISLCTAEVSDFVRGE